VSDRHIVILTLIALVLHLAVFALPLLPPIGIAMQPALAVITALTALGVLSILLLEMHARDTATRVLLVIEILALAAAVWILLVPSTPATWCLGFATTVHLLLVLAVLAFMTFFKMNRLW
jgi:hypothetical protein